MYSVNNNTAYINGAKGIYDGKVNNSSARYGRNSASNYLGYINDLRIDTSNPSINTKNLATNNQSTFDAKMDGIDAFIKQLDKEISSLPPIQFEYNYSENKGGKLDVISLMGASYEEMGSKSYVSVKDLNKKMNETFREKSVLAQIADKVKGFFTGEKTPKINFHPFRPKLDTAVCDFNKDKKIDIGEYATSILIADKLSDGEINGTITNEGENASLAYVNKKNQKAASADLRYLYEEYNLKQAQDSFLADKNNLVQG